MTALGLSAVSVLSLAVLRPVVQAQALPTTKQSVGNTNPVTVQLIGLTDAGLTRGKGKGWDAGGVRLSPALYQKATALPIGMDPYPGARVVNVALHISPDTAQDLTLSYQFSHCDAYGEDAGGLEKQAESNGLASAEYARVGGNRLLTVRFPTSVTKTDIRVSISSGVWQKDTCTVTPLAQTLDGSSYQMVTFPEAGKEFRVVAIDTNGVRRLPSSSMDHGNGMPTSRALHQIVAQFNNLPPAQIREILLETRPIVWKEFKDVALQSVKSR